MKKQWKKPDIKKLNVEYTSCYDYSGCSAGCTPRKHPKHPKHPKPPRRH